jgi:hypothetical protein
LGEDYGRYGEDHLVVVLTWIAVQVIENAGILGLFGRPMPTDEDYGRTLAAFDRIGALGGAEVLREAFAQFSGHRPPLDVERRVAEYGAVPTRIQRDLNRRFLENVPDIARRLVYFIHERRLQP